MKRRVKYKTRVYATDVQARVSMPQKLRKYLGLRRGEWVEVTITRTKKPKLLNNVGY